MAGFTFSWGRNKSCTGATSGVAFRHCVWGLLALIVGVTYRDSLDMPLLSSAVRRVLPVVVVTTLLVGCGTSEVTDEKASSNTEAGDGHDHDHPDESRVREWDADAVPSLSISVTADGDDGYVLVVDAPGFTITGADVLDPVPGEGHAHLYVDGDLMTMIYGPEFRIPNLDPGTYQLMVTLSTNDHLEYTVGGEVLSTMATLVVEEIGED